jgi:hypothetical protein
MRHCELPSTTIAMAALHILLRRHVLVSRNQHRKAGFFGGVQQIRH